MGPGADGPCSLPAEKAPLVLSNQSIYLIWPLPLDLGEAFAMMSTKWRQHWVSWLHRTGTGLAYVAFDPKRADGAVALRYSLDITQRTLCARYRRGSGDRLHRSNTHSTYRTQHSINIPCGTSAVDSSWWVKLQTIPYLRDKRCVVLI